MSQLSGKKLLYWLLPVYSPNFKYLGWIFFFLTSLFCFPLSLDHAGLTINTPGDLAISLGTSDTVSSKNVCFSKTINMGLSFEFSSIGGTHDRVLYFV